MKKENEAIKDRITGDIRNIFDQEKEDYSKPVKAEIILNMKVMEIEIMHYQLKNISLKLDHT